jgi:hypothetical protein
MRSHEEIEAARELARAGHNASEIARKLGVARSTVRYWRSKWQADGEWPAPSHAARRKPRPDRDRLPVRAYCYLLGLYLGDGCLSVARGGVFRLRIKLDSAYPGIVASAAVAMEATMPANKVAFYRHPRDNWVEVSSYSRHWRYLLPQHGVGRKHERAIVLADWQRALTHRDPPSLIRGLLHSDGCRFVARQKGRNGRTYEYARYAFSNQSTDIQKILCQHLDLLGVHWTVTGAGREQIAIATRGGVAILDEFVGPKA